MFRAYCTISDKEEIEINKFSTSSSTVLQFKNQECRNHASEQKYGNKHTEFLEYNGKIRQRSTTYQNVCKANMNGNHITNSR